MTDPRDPKAEEPQVPDETTPPDESTAREQFPMAPPPVEHPPVNDPTTAPQDDVPRAPDEPPAPAWASGTPDAPTHATNGTSRANAQAPGAPDEPYKPNLGPGHLIKSGWRILRARPALMLFTAALLALLQYIGSLVAARFWIQSMVVATAQPAMMPFPTLLVLFVLGFVMAMLTVGQFSMLLQVHRGRGMFSDLFAAFGKTPKIVAVLVLGGLAVGIGSMLLVAPGVILLLGLLFAPLIALESDLSIFGCLKGSWRLTKGYKGPLFLYTIIQALLVIPLAGAVQFTLLSAQTRHPELAQLTQPETFILTNTLSFVLSLVFIPVELIFLGGWVVAYDELLARYRKDDAA